MIPSLHFRNGLVWSVYSARFFKQHFPVVFGLGLAAALGRSLQLGALGAVTVGQNLVLELVVESARVLLFIYALGWSNVRVGVAHLVRFVTDWRNFRLNGRRVVQKLRTQWITVILNTVSFLAIAFVINFCIDYIAYQTCLYVSLKTRGVLAEGTSEWALILFFKNLSVIPFTLIFNAVLLRWLANRIPGATPS
jgi:hypothetical protein